MANANFKAHTSLSFRNEDDSLKSWHLNDRNKSLRQRRSPGSSSTTRSEQNHRGNELSESDIENSIEIAPRNAFIEVSDDGGDVTDINDDLVIKFVRNKRNNIDNNNINNLDKLSNGLEFMSSSSVDGMRGNSNDPSRSRRDTTINCGSSVNTKPRQLNIGCSAENKIDVSPQCFGNDDMEEGKGCARFIVCECGREREIWNQGNSSLRVIPLFSILTSVTSWLRLSVGVCVCL